MYGAGGLNPPPPQSPYGASRPPVLPYIVYQTTEDPPPSPLNGLAIASMVLGIVSLVLTCMCCGMISWLPSLIGLILGIVARAKGNRSGMGVAGIVLNSIALLFAFIMVVLLFIGTYASGYNDNSIFWDGVYL